MTRWDERWQDDQLFEARGEDPFAMSMSSPLDDMQRRRAGRSGRQAPAAQPPAPQKAAPSSPSDSFGERTGAALDAIDFPSFVAGLITGTFQAIVDSTAQQMRQFAELVASLSQTVDQFSSENVSEGQVLAWLAETYPADVELESGEPGGGVPPRLVPRAPGSSPDWLSRFGLAGAELTEELLADGLLPKARRGLAEQRMQQLSTLVLMGVNRIVIDQGTIRAKLQFHAVAMDKKSAELSSAAAGQKGGIASQHQGLRSGASAAVSTVKGNVQAESSMKAELMGEVNIRFRTETFPLERFADSQAMQLISRHAEPPASVAAPPASAPTPEPPTSEPPAPETS